MIARGIVRPDPMYRAYDVEIRFEHGYPRVRIINPDLEVAPEQLADTHMDRAQEPCLFRPSTRDWRPESMRFTTIITWLQQWIIFHEIWKATDEWEGGGEHPASQNGAS